MSNRKTVLLGVQFDDDESYQEFVSLCHRDGLTVSEAMTVAVELYRQSASGELYEKAEESDGRR
jgi:hypothetical protein